MMNGTTPNDSYDYTTISEIENPELSDVLYMTIGSASGSAYNGLTTLGKHVVKAWRQSEPNISNVEITDTSFKISTYKTTDMDTVADEFTLKRTGTDPVARAVLISPKNAEVKCGNSQAFMGEAFGYNLDTRAVTWSVSGNESSGTTISSSGVLTVAADETAENLTVMAASAEDPDGKTASVQVTLPDNTPVVVNVGQGVTYKLPETIDGVSVSWENSAGEAATVVDTSLVGYRMYRGKLSDGTFINYRVNVGEYKELMRDDFEAYTEDRYEAEFTESITGGKFAKGEYTASDSSTPKLVKDGTNTVLEAGPYSTKWGKVRWTPDGDELGDAFKISAKLKVAEFDPSTSSGTTNYLFQIGPVNTAAVSFRAKTNTSDAITKTEVRYESTTANNAEVDVTWESNNGKYSMKDYVELSIEGNSTQYSTYLNDVELAHSQVWKDGSGILKNGLTAIDVGKTSSSADTNAITYVDDVVYSKAIYVTDKLDEQSVKATLNQGDSAVQTATVTLNMSDGTTKDFTVNYTADTSALGTSNVYGTIDGFDGTIPVTVTVEKSDVKTIIKDVNATAAGIETATIQKVKNITSGVAVFAYYGSNDKMEAVKFVPFAESDFTGDVAELNVGLVFPTDVEGGYIKGFIFNNLTSLIPLDTVFSTETSN